MFDFQKLDGYQKAKEFNQDITKILASKVFDSMTNDQLRRASLLMLNIAEGSSRFSNKDRRNFPTLTALVKDEGKLKCLNMQWTIKPPSIDRKTGKPVTYELLNSTCEKVFYNLKDIVYPQRCLA